jgi:hypothetical protein
MASTKKLSPVTDLSKANLDTNDTITLYRASPKFPDNGNFEKGTYFATSEDSARWNAESHYTGEPKDINVRKYTLPKSSVIKEGNNYRLNTEYPAKVTADLASEAKRNKANKK